MNLGPLQALYDHQGGRCAICEMEKTLVVDHDHETGLVRGLLCGRCNTSEGVSNYPWLRAYRANPPAATLGLKVVYGEHLPRVPRARRPAVPARPDDWLDRMLRDAEHCPPVGTPIPAMDSISLRAYRRLCRKHGRQLLPTSVSLDEWRAALQEAERLVTPFELTLVKGTSWEESYAERAFAQIGRERTLGRQAG